MLKGNFIQFSDYPVNSEKFCKLFGVETGRSEDTCFLTWYSLS